MLLRYNLQQVSLCLIMECVYTPDLELNTVTITVSDEEAKHCKVRRLQDNEPIILVNGRGLAALAMLKITGSYNKVEAVCKDFKHNYGEIGKDITIVLGWLDHKERLEFALEKCTELGVKSFILTKSQYSSIKKPDTERLQEKLIATIKQCKRSYLPTVSVTDSLAAALSSVSSKLYIADISGQSSKTIDTKLTICIGPEGGFSDEEQNQLRSKNNSVLFNLGKTRLRAETAAITATALFALG